MKDSAYKLAYLDKTKILSAARKALIAADAHYYAWSTQRTGTLSGKHGR